MQVNVNILSKSILLEDGSSCLTLGRVHYLRAFCHPSVDLDQLSLCSLTRELWSCDNMQSFMEGDLKPLSLCKYDRDGPSLKMTMFKTFTVVISKSLKYTGKQHIQSNLTSDLNHVFPNVMLVIYVYICFTVHIQTLLSF